MKRVALLAGVAVLTTVPGAFAHTTSYSSEIKMEVECQVPCQARVAPHPARRGLGLFVGGLVTSEKQTCVGQRTVKIFRLEGSSQSLVDTDKTSKGGAWSGFGGFKGSDGVKAVLTKRNIGRRGHKHICKGASETFDLDN